MKKLFLTIALIFTLVFAFAACNGGGVLSSLFYPDGSVGLAYVINEDGETCTITGIGECTDTDIVVPIEIDGLKVTAIEEKSLF